MFMALIIFISAIRKKKLMYLWLRVTHSCNLPIYGKLEINEKLHRIHNPFVFTNSVTTCHQHLAPDTTEQEERITSLTRVRMAPRSSSFEAGSSLPRNLCARLLRCLLDALLQAPVCQPRRSRGFFTRGGRCRNGNATAQRAANNSNSSTDATHRGQEAPVMVTAYCPRHGPSSYPCDDDGSASPKYTPATPSNSPTPTTPP